MRCRYGKPWTRSTGPRSDSGKARSSMNAWVHGWRSGAYAAVCAVLSHQAAFVRRIQKNVQSPCSNDGFSLQSVSQTNVKETKCCDYLH